MTRWCRVDHVQLCIPPGEEAMARAAEFYVSLLGLGPIDKPPSLEGNESIRLRRGEVEVHLGIERNDWERSRRHPAFEVSEFDALRVRLEEAGVEISEETPIPGRTRFSVRDPFDNRIELLEYEVGKA